MKQCDISLVIPVYGCSKALKELCQRIVKVVIDLKLAYEIILVNDRSPDDSWLKISELCSANETIIGVNLSRNFGQHNAIDAGFSVAQGSWIVVMDCDLQDKPEEIHRLYSEAQKGFDVVLGKRVLRRDGFLKRSFSKLFYHFLGYLTNTHQDPTIGNYGIYKREVIDAIRSMNDYAKFLPTQAQWVGFRTTTIPIAHNERKYGKTTYNFKGLLRLALNVILSFSDKPLRLTVKLGGAISFLSILFGISTLVRYFQGVITEIGYTSIALLIAFFFGVTISIVGMVGLYIGRIFEQVKGRPNFIIQNIINGD